MIQRHSAPATIFTYTDAPPTMLEDLGAAWRDRAACAGRWDLFDEIDVLLGDRGKVYKKDRARYDELIGEAWGMCSTCPVFDLCEQGRQLNPPTGGASIYSYRAGRLDSEFRAPRERRKPAVVDRDQCPKCDRTFGPGGLACHLPIHDRVIECGTYRAFQAHKRRGEKCAECSTAVNAMQWPRKASRRRERILAKRRGEGAA